MGALPPWNPERVTDADSFASMIAQRMRDTVEWHKRNYERPDTEIWRVAHNGQSQYILEEARSAPPEKLDWYHLQALEEAEPGAGYARWEEMKAKAREWYGKGVFLANATLAEDCPDWSRAKFCALYEALHEAWDAKNPIEAALIDIMVTAFANYLYWLGRASRMREYEDPEWQPGRHVTKRERWKKPEPAKLLYSEDTDRATEHADKWNRIFLRNLRALRDLRRYAPVIIQNAEQVNLAGQQVNVKG
jgi:hypothetical protein